MEEKAREVVPVVAAAAEAADDDTGLIATRGDDAAARSAAHAVSNRLEAWRIILLMVLGCAYRFRDDVKDTCTLRHFCRVVNHSPRITVPAQSCQVKTSVVGE